MTIITQVYAARWTIIATGILLYGLLKFLAYRRLAAFKGPFSTGWFEFWHTRAILSMRSYLAYKEVNEKYGKLWRYWTRFALDTLTELNGQAMADMLARSHR
jgi:hypothetical protein